MWMALRVACVSLGTESAARSREKIPGLAMMCAVVLGWFLSYRFPMFLFEVWNRDLIKRGFCILNSSYVTLA